MNSVPEDFKYKHAYLYIKKVYRKLIDNLNEVRDWKNTEVGECIEKIESAMELVDLADSWDHPVVMDKRKPLNGKTRGA